jgi:hypothetical protein
VLPLGLALVGELFDDVPPMGHGFLASLGNTSEDVTVVSLAMTPLIAFC